MQFTSFFILICIFPQNAVLSLTSHLYSLVGIVQEEISSLLCLGFSTFCSETEIEPGLIFDRFTRSLFQLPTDVPNDLKCGAWAIACPAKTPEEIDFSRETSFTENPLFVKKIYQKGDKASEVKKRPCKNPFKISLVYNVKSFTFQVGFEIYYDLAVKRYFHYNNPVDFKSPKEIVSNLTTLWRSGKYVGFEYYRVTKNAIGSDVKELWMNNNFRMGFAWIYLVKFKFDFSKKIVKKMDYYIGPNSRWPVFREQCEDNSLGNELLKDVDDKIYDRAEETLTKNYKVPSDVSCESNVKCFKRWSIVPISQFRFGTLSAPLCSELTTIPIWKFMDSETMLNKVDQYLYSLYRTVNEPLHIIAGTTDEIEFPKRRGFGKSTVYLDPAKKILPVPKIIYKIVEYRVKNCKLDEKSCWYSAVIIIHNDPLFRTHTRLCSEESTKNWGWLEILRESWDYIYVCPRDKIIKWKLLGITLYREPVIRSADLKLSAFPLSDDGETIKPKDIRNDIKLNFDKFTNEKGDLNDGDRIIEITHINNVNPDDEDLILDAEAEEKSKTGED